MSAICPITQLPRETLILIFQHFEKKELARTEQVCLLWKEIINQYKRGTWGLLFSNNYPLQSNISNPKKLIILLHPLPRLKKCPEAEICKHLSHLDNVPLFGECINVYRHVYYNIRELASINIYALRKKDWKRIASLTAILGIGILKLIC